MVKIAFLYGWFIALTPLIYAQSGASLLRDYVGVIHQSYHPDVIDYMNKLKQFAQKNDEADTVKGIEAFLKGGFGSGFIYVDPEGNNYVLTNYHVITRAHTISIEFEKPGGAKTRYNGLAILAADDELDAALLAFPAGERPFAEGLPFAEEAPAEGSGVFSAGFPGLGANPIWQFGQGIVSNGRVTIPASDTNPIELGPWIQHTAQIDAGNSGGPLLVAAPGLSIPYAVAGINTASGVNRQAANYAIPIDRVSEFIAGALSKKDPGTERKKLEEKIDGFVKGLAGNRGVYTHISRYLSNDFVAGSAEFAIAQVEDKANYTIRRDIFSQYIFTVIDYSVGWLVEAELRELNGSGPIRPATGTLTANSDGTWTLPLVFGDKEYAVTWINEFGLWRIKSAGSLGGGKADTVKRLNRRKTQEALRADSWVSLTLGYDYLGLGAGDPRGSAADVAVIFGKDVNLGFHAIFQGAGFGALELTLGYKKGIKLGTAALIPYGNAGIGFSWHEGDPSSWDDSIIDKLTMMSFSLRAGLMVTTSYVPGLAFYTAYQFAFYDNGFFSPSRGVPLPSSTHGILLGVGYLWNP
jgi:serine protease Do